MLPSRRLAVGLAGITAAALLPLVPAAVAADQGAPLTDPLRSQQWALDVVRADGAWSTSTGRGVVVAVIDSGVRIDHADLAGQVLPGATFVDCPEPATPCGDGRWEGRALDPDTDLSPQGVVAAYDEYTNLHGTHVAGIIAAATHNGIGISGVAPDARILPVKVLQDGTGDEKDVARGIRWAADNGADIINMSLGAQPGAELTGPAEVALLRRAVEYARSRGVLVVAAAGNTPLYPFCSPPSSFRGVLCATGVTRSGTPLVASQMGFAPSPARSTRDTVAAPGGAGGLDNGLNCTTTALSDVLSTVPVFIGSRCNGAAGGGDYFPLSGTSMAAPHVAGVAALLLAQCRGVEETIRIIKTTARTPVLGGTLGPKPYYGHGIVDATRAVAAPGARC